MATARCDGVVVTDTAGIPYCEDLVGAPLAWVAVEPFSIEDLDSEVLGSHFAVGFVIYATAWSIGKAAGLVLQSVSGKK